MNYKVVNVVSDRVVEVDPRWSFSDLQGGRVRIAGLLPSKKQDLEKNVKKLEDTILGQVVILERQISVAGDTLHATVRVHDKLVHELLPERAGPLQEPLRWLDPMEKRRIAKARSRIVTEGKNPIRDIPIEYAPYLGNIKYPYKPWDRDFKRNRELIHSLYSDTHPNRDELDRWFDVFLKSPQREAPLVVVGEVGVGKTWWLAHKLDSLTSDKYHTIMIDLRYCMNNDNLESSIEEELNEYLIRTVKGMSYMYQDFEALLGEAFDPEDPEIMKLMLKEYQGLPMASRIRRRLRFYNLENSPELIVVFDNVDHYSPDEQDVVVDMCNRLIGYAPGVKVIIAIRPTTKLRMSRHGKFFGEAVPRPVYLKSPEPSDVIRCRLATDNQGRARDMDSKLPGTDMTWSDLATKFEESDHAFGASRLLRDLCTATKSTLPTENDIAESTDEQKDHLDSNYDVRHYLKLFRRFLRADSLMDFHNIGSAYHAIHALMLRGNEPLDEHDAYLLNLFDNNAPEMKGNALIRYRVLEYCHLFSDLGDAFDVYFEALGCSPSMARSIVGLAEEAGFVNVDYVRGKDGQKLALVARLTVPGERHRDMITNLWYIIAIKTGMNIYEEYILFGDEARTKASEYVRSEVMLKQYAAHGWVPEENLVAFISDQEALEDMRVGEFQKNHPEYRVQVKNWRSQVNEPWAEIWYAYERQAEIWRKQAGDKR